MPIIISIIILITFIAFVTLIFKNRFFDNFKTENPIAVCCEICGELYTMVPGAVFDYTYEPDKFAYMSAFCCNYEEYHIASIVYSKYEYAPVTNTANMDKNYFIGCKTCGEYQIAQPPIPSFILYEFNDIM